MKRRFINRHYAFLLLLMLAICSCEPEAQWTEDIDTKIDMDIHTVSAGYVECSFSTNNDAYYLVSIERVRDGYDPMAHQKQFMMLALDSAYVEYLAWRNRLLLKGELNVAPFSSHSLQYGTTDQFFTSLNPDSDYWLFAFVVNPETMLPMGKLHMEKIHTTSESVVDVHFEYRINGAWDYIYPVSSEGVINTTFPYIATTRDSIEIDLKSYASVRDYFVDWGEKQFSYPQSTQVLYGVHVTENNGESSYLKFQVGHTYYTAIFGYDGMLKQGAVYCFRWYGDDTEYLFVETDDNNMYKTKDCSQ